jgi:beta-N-acetylhexosaminidase
MSDNPEQPWWAGPYWQQGAPDSSAGPAAQSSPAPPADPSTPANLALPDLNASPDLAEIPTSRMPVPGLRSGRGRSLATFMDGEPTHVLPAVPMQDDRALADADTDIRPVARLESDAVWAQATHILAAPRPVARPRPLGISERARVIGLRVVLVVALCVLGVRAGLASLAFMSPGGEIVGWSRLPVVHHLVPDTNLTQQLTPDEYAALLVSHLSLDDKLGQMMIVQFQGTDLNPDLVTMVASQGAGGVLFFGVNIQSAQQVRSLTKNLQQLAAIPLIMAVDQEGGRVNRFEPIVGPLPSAASLQTPADARERGVDDATLLHAYGFNLNLAPVVDVGDANPQLYTRTFGTDPARVAELAGAYIDGLQASGQVTAIPKHFPGGLASSTIDPHLGMPTLYRSRADWEATDLAPYGALFAQHDVRGVMISHEMIPAVDQQLPTSLSPAIGTNALREQLGFQGVAITDDLVSMDAITVRWTVPQASVLAIIAGSDVITAPSYSNLVAKIKDEIKSALQDGRLSRERIDESVKRILTLKIKMGLIALPAGATPTPSPQVTPQTTPQGIVPGPVWWRMRAA